MARDPVDAIGDVSSELWLSHLETFTLHRCMAVSKAWNQCVRKRLAFSANVSSLDNNGAHIDDRIIRRILLHSPIMELHLHGLTNITDDALEPLWKQRGLRLVSLTYCTGLTTAIGRHLPPSVRELRISGCHRMYSHLTELRVPTLDIHVCEPAVKGVEHQALRGFRFVDPALRAGVRQGTTCNCPHATTGLLAIDCASDCKRIPDISGVLRPPEIWHASSFDWIVASKLPEIRVSAASQRERQRRRHDAAKLRGGGGGASGGARRRARGGARVARPSRLSAHPRRR